MTSLLPERPCLLVALLQEHLEQLSSSRCGIWTLISSNENVIPQDDSDDLSPPRKTLPPRNSCKTTWNNFRPPAVVFGRLSPLTKTSSRKTTPMTSLLPERPCLLVALLQDYLEQVSSSRCGIWALVSSHENVIPQDDSDDISPPRKTLPPRSTPARLLGTTFVLPLWHLDACLHQRKRHPA